MSDILGESEVEDGMGPHIQWFPGFKEGSRIFHIGDGFHFYLKDARRNRPQLRCVRYYSEGCLGQASVAWNGADFRSTHAHCHPPDPYFQLEREMHSNIRRRCIEGGLATFRDVLFEETVRHPLQVQSRFTITKKRNTMWRARRSSYPPIPNSLTNLSELLSSEDNQHLCMTVTQDDLLFAGASGQTRLKTKCLFFMSRRQRNYMSSVKKVFADGTWDSRPAIPKCYQLFCVSTTRRNQLLPLCIVMMQSKSFQCYSVVMRFLLRAVPGFSPNTIHCDYEKAQIKAWRTFFSSCDIEGCFFHYAKDVSTYSRCLGLTFLIRQNPYVFCLVRCCCALALLPAEDIEDGFGDIVVKANEFGVLEELRPLFQYIFQQWIPLTHVMSVWNSSDRTNNAAESLNSLFKSYVKVPRPDLWRFLEAVSKLEHNFNVDRRILDRGGLPGRKRKLKNIRNDLRIEGLSHDYSNGNIDRFTFLRRASRVMINVFVDRVAMVK